MSGTETIERLDARVRALEHLVFVMLLVSHIPPSKWPDVLEMVHIFIGGGVDERSILTGMAIDELMSGVSTRPRARSPHG